MLRTMAQKVLRNAAARIRRWRNPVLAHPLEEASENQIDAALASAGLDRAQLFEPETAVAAYRVRMAGMMKTLGVDAQPLARGSWKSLKRADANCAACRETGRCERWLMWGRPNAGPQVFCPNAQYFMFVAEEQDRVRRERA